MAQVSLKNSTMTISDGGSNSINVTIGEGNITYTERRNVEYKLDRGNIDDVRLGDDEPVEVSFDIKWTNISGEGDTSGAPTVEDALKQTNDAAAWATADTANPCAPYAVDIAIAIAYGCTSEQGQDETITLGEFRWEELSHNLADGQISCTGHCNITVATSNRT